MKGLGKRSTPGFYIHTSANADFSDFAFGQYSATKIYDDIEDMDEIKALIESHQGVDQAVLSAPNNVKTAIVSPPTVYGTGVFVPQNKGQISLLIDAILKREEAFQVNRGLNWWNAIHVRDIARIYLALVEAAELGGGKATWGKEGYYFAESQSYVYICYVGADGRNGRTFRIPLRILLIEKGSYRPLRSKAFRWKR